MPVRSSWRRGSSPRNIPTYTTTKTSAATAPSAPGGAGVDPVHGGPHPLGVRPIEEAVILAEVQHELVGGGECRRGVERRPAGRLEAVVPVVDGQEPPAERRPEVDVAPTAGQDHERHVGL